MYASSREATLWMFSVTPLFSEPQRASSSITWQGLSEVRIRHLLRQTEIQNPGSVSLCSFPGVTLASLLTNDGDNDGAVVIIFMQVCVYSYYNTKRHCLHRERAAMFPSSGPSYLCPSVLLSPTPPPAVRSSLQFSFCFQFLSGWVSRHTDHFRLPFN